MGDKKQVRGFYFARKMAEGMPVVENGQEVKQFEEAMLPEYQTFHSAGADFFCAQDVVIPSIWKNLFKAIVHHKKVLKSMETAECTVFEDAATKNVFSDEPDELNIKPVLIHTGIKASMAEDEVLEIYNRSSGPKRGLVMANSVGIIDADYFENTSNDGEIMFAFYNFKLWDITIKKGDRIGQGIFKKFLRPVEGLNVKEAVRTGGFDSTSKK